MRFGFDDLSGTGDVGGVVVRRDRAPALSPTRAGIECQALLAPAPPTALM